MKKTPIADAAKTAVDTPPAPKEFLIAMHPSVAQEIVRFLLDCPVKLNPQPLLNAMQNNTIRVPVQDAMRD